jgi:hypothetical protein
MVRTLRRLSTGVMMTTTTTTTIALDRRFRRATENGERPFRGLFRGDFKLYPIWADLLEMRRVVILAEAGSGKSTEFKTQCAALSAAGKFAFSASVSDVVQADLEGALVPGDRARLAAWKADDTADCWLFIDSVDEARDQGFHFETAARKLADAVTGCEERTHIYISSRFTDWDATADRVSMEKWLSMPEPPPALAPDFEQEVRDTLHHKERPAPADPKDPIAVLVLEPLEREQVRRFAEGSGINNVDEFLAAVDHGNLWTFAARPLDLGWMVDYWQANRRLGTLRQMIEASLSARLLDPDPRRRRRDPIEATAAGHALNRIGASFLLCGKDSLRIPESGLDLAPAEKSLPLEAILPDWADGHRLLLLGRPVFDPATLGRARLHNDNEGTLRCYLAARWLNERLQQNCPLQTVFDILFADLYGYRLVRPEMLETSVWLAGDNAAVADELISRAPFNLVRHGDAGSLPIPVRIRAFSAALAQVENIDREKLWFLDDSLRRFADPALDPHFPEWWRQSAGNEEAQHLILRLIWHGKQRGGLDIARTAAFDRSADQITQLLGARALIALGNPDDQDRLSSYITDNVGTLSRSFVLEGLDSLFPARFSVAEFFALVDQIGVEDSDGHKSVLPIDGDIVDALSTPKLLGAFVDAIVARSGEFSGDHSDHPFREAFSRIAALAAIKLLQWHPHQIPDAVTDLVLLLHETNSYFGLDDEFGVLGKLFEVSEGRRRSSFWRAIKRLRTHPYVTDADNLNIWFVQHLGWPVTLTRDDLAWLIQDIRERAEPQDRMVALRAAHTLWREFGEDADVLEQITQAAATDEAMAGQLALLRNPPPDPPEHVRQMARFEETRRRNEAQAEERDKSWVDLVAELRADPSVFDHLSPQTDESVDSRLFHLWQFLTWRLHSRSRYSIDSLDTVAPIFGPELTQRFAEALIAFAYNRLPVALPGDAIERRRVTNFDIMALGGLSLAAATTPNWVQTLSPIQAAQAAQLALIELNGFPDYLVALAATHPQAVRAVLVGAVTGQLAATDPAAHGMLDRLEYADPSLGRLIVDDLVRYLSGHPEIDAVMLEKVTSVLLRAMPFTAEGFQEVVAHRLIEADPITAAHYLLMLFGLEGDAAVDAFQAKMSTLDPPGQATLCCALLPRLVGSRFNREVTPPTALSVARLEQLLILAFEGVRPSEDIERPSGEVYSRELRDEAQDARNLIFDRLLKIPGEATHAALKRLEQIPDFPIRPEWMRVHALRRAEADAELPPWEPEDVLTFERTFDRAPTTTGDLQLLARRRIEDIQHDLIHGKFTQGDTLQLLPDENAVQRWIATQFEARQKEAYTVQRETHYAEEKEPDITLISRHSGVELPIEIKVADGLSIRELEAALVNQLCRQYLRHASTRHGILLVVHQKARKEGWMLEEGKPLVPYEAVVARLRELARTVREQSAMGPQPIVQTFDVSHVVAPGEKKRIARGKRTTPNEG